MKLGIIGLPRAGKSTVFDALTKNISGAEHKGEDRIEPAPLEDCGVKDAREGPNDTRKGTGPSID